MKKIKLKERDIENLVKKIMKEHQSEIHFGSNYNSIPSDKKSMIISSIDEAIEDGDLNRLKGINKGLPTNWENDYLINNLIDWLNN